MTIHTHETMVHINCLKYQHKLCIKLYNHTVGHNTHTANIAHTSQLLLQPRYLQCNESGGVNIFLNIRLACNIKKYIALASSLRISQRQSIHRKHSSTNNSYYHNIKIDVTLLAYIFVVELDYRLISMSQTVDLCSKIQK